MDMDTSSVGCADTFPSRGRLESGEAPTHTEENVRPRWLTEAQAAAWRTLIVQRTLYELDDQETAMCISTLERMIEELEG